jgi:hypothetical protein
MAAGRTTHSWDLLAPLICWVVSPHVKKALSIEQVHPYLDKAASKRSNWLEFRAAIKRERQ